MGANEIAKQQSVKSGLTCHMIDDARHSTNEMPYKALIGNAYPEFYKIIITPEAYSRAAFRLAKKIIESDFRPDIILPVWRGGAEPTMKITGALERCGLEFDHFPIQSYRYRSDNLGETKPIGIRSIPEAIDIINGKSVGITGQTRTHERILLSDDVFDEGITIQKIREQLRTGIKHSPDIRVATVYWKSYANKTLLKPDFYDTVFDRAIIDGIERKPWIVFPHEINDLDDRELELAYPEVYKIFNPQTQR